MPKAAKSGTSSEAKSTRNKDKHYSREKKKSGAPRTFLIIALEFSKLLNSGVAFCCDKYCGFKIINSLLKVSLTNAKEVDLNRKLTASERDNLIPTFQKSCQNYFEPVEECINGACSKKKNAHEQGFEVVNTIYKFETPFDPSNEKAFLAMPNKGIADKNNKRARVNQSMATTSPSSGYNSDKSDRQPGEDANSTMRSSSSASVMDDYTLVEQIDHSVAVSPVATTSAVPMAIASPAAANQPSVKSKTNKSLVYVSEEDEVEAEPFIPIAQEAFVPLLSLGVNGYGYAPRQIAPSSRFPNGMRYIDVFPNVRDLPPPINSFAFVSPFYYQHVKYLNN